MTRSKLLIAIFAGMAIGAVGAEAIRAQTSAPPAYLVAEVKVSNPEPYKAYSAQVPATLTPFGGRFVAGPAKPEAVEGTPPDGAVVLIEFPNMEKAKAFLDSPDYAKIRPIRLENATSRIYMVEGRPPAK